LDVGDFWRIYRPLYEKMGVLLNEMHNVEQKKAEDNSQPYPTIPPIRRPSRPHRKPQTSSAPPLTPPRPITAHTRQTSPNVARSRGQLLKSLSASLPYLPLLKTSMVTWTPTKCSMGFSLKMIQRCPLPSEKTTQRINFCPRL
jgi:hypothetical protein